MKTRSASRLHGSTFLTCIWIKRGVCRAAPSDRTNLGDWVKNVRLKTTWLRIRSAWSTWKKDQEVLRTRLTVERKLTQEIPRGTIVAVLRLRIIPVISGTERRDLCVTEGRRIQWH